MKANKMLWSATYDVDVFDSELVDDFLFICSESISIQVLNLKLLKIEYEVKLDYMCRGIDINTDKTILAIATDVNVILRDFKKKQTIKKMAVGDWPSTLKFNPEGNRLLVALYDGKVIKIDLRL